MSADLAFPFTRVEDERLYRLHKLFAESYVTNLRNLEAPWKPVIASVLDAIVKKVGAGRPSIDIAVQQEQPLAPPALSAASTNANRTMTGSEHKGTTLSPNDMGHEAVDYLVCAELKRSISRVHIRKGLKKHSRAALSTFLRAATRQAQRQAFVAVKRPNVVNSDLILIAASGPFWMWAPARRISILEEFSDTPMDKLLEQVTDGQQKDSKTEEFNALGFDYDGDDQVIDDTGPIPTTPFNNISPEEVVGKNPNLTWSNVVMLDTKESKAELGRIVRALIDLVGEK